MKKNLIHFFAVVGFGTFILLACSVDDIADSMNNNNNSQITSNTGKYQVIKWSTQTILVLNSETGVMKSFAPFSLQWQESGYDPVTFTH